MITSIEKEFKEIRNDESILFLAYKASSASDLDDLHEIKKGLDKVISKLQGVYLIQNGREFLFEKPTKNRKNTTEWRLSRLALLDCLKRISKLEKPPLGATLFMSISHTKNAAIATCLVSKTITGLGIDIEDKKRPIYAKALKKVFLKESFEDHKIDLGKWLMKESAFKSITDNQKLKLYDIEIVESKEEVSGHYARYNDNYISFNLFSIDNLLCAIALNSSKGGLN